MSQPSVVSELALADAYKQAMELQQRLLQARIERLSSVIREHGLPLPGEDPRLGASDGEHLSSCRAVVEAAYRLLQGADELERALDELRAVVGSGWELLQEQPWRP